MMTIVCTFPSLYPKRRHTARAWWAKDARKDEVMARPKKTFKHPDLGEIRGPFWHDSTKLHDYMVRGENGWIPVGQLNDEPLESTARRARELSRRIIIENNERTTNH